jgi:HSP20 family protein
MEVRGGGDRPSTPEQRRSVMELTKRIRGELDRPQWPAWPQRRWMVDWADTMRDLLEQTELKVEEYEDDGYLVVRAEMPGIDPDKDVEVTVTDRTLHLRAERRSEKTTEDKKRYRSEFHYGSFSRSVRLPAGATEGDIRATYTDGVLEVRIPIDDAEASTQKVPISRS